MPGKPFLLACARRLHYNHGPENASRYRSVLSDPENLRRGLCTVHRTCSCTIEQFSKTSTDLTTHVSIPNIASLPSLYTLHPSAARGHSPLVQSIYHTYIYIYIYIPVLKDGNDGAWSWCSMWPRCAQRKTRIHIHIYLQREGGMKRFPLRRERTRFFYFSSRWTLPRAMYPRMYHMYIFPCAPTMPSPRAAVNSFIYTRFQILIYTFVLPRPRCDTCVRRHIARVYDFSFIIRRGRLLLSCGVSHWFMRDASSISKFRNIYFWEDGDRVILICWRCCGLKFARRGYFLNARRYIDEMRCVQLMQVLGISLGVLSDVFYGGARLGHDFAQN